MPRRLILFDIDCTLLSTAGAGMAALDQACREVLREALRADEHAIHPGGQTDPAIVRSLLQHHRVPHQDWPRLERRLFEVYPELLARELAARRPQSRLEPGVAELLTRLSQEPDFCLGVLTGNLEVTARMKLELFQLNPTFPIGAFGCDSHDRNALGPIALERGRRHYAEAFEAAETWFVGDTDRDIQAARAVGARVLAVATGGHSERELQALEPDACFSDLGDTEAVMQRFHGKS